MLCLCIFSFVFSQKKVGYYFVDKNHQDTICVFDLDTLYYSVIIGPDGPAYHKCNGKMCNGFIEEYYLNGQIKHLGLYENGQIRNGYSRYYYENGLLEEQGQLKNGNRVGQWVWFEENGLLNYSLLYDSLSRKNIKISFNDNGMIKEYDVFNYDSVCVITSETFFKTGELESHYHHPLCNKNQGIKREYYQNGILKYSRKEFYDIKKCLDEYFDETGKLIKTEEFSNGKLIKQTLIE